VPTHDLRDLVARPFLRGEVVWSGPNETLKQVYGKMQLFDISQVPVMDGRKVIGIVDEAEVLLRVAEHTGKGFDTPVGEVMRPDFATIDVKTPVERLLRVFERSSAVCVMDHDEFLGLITPSDFINYLRKRTATA